MQRLLELLSFDGRLSRLGYWRAYLVLSIAFAISWCLGLFAMLAIGSFGALLLLPILPILLAGVAIAVRRLHDRNRSAWWLAVFYGVPWTIIGALSSWRPQSLQASLLFLALELVGVALSIWGFVEIAFGRGTRGGNRFGAEPAVAT